MATRLKDGRWKATWLNPETKKREPFHSWESPEEAEHLKSERVKAWKSTHSASGVIRPETLEDYAMKFWWPSVEIKRPNTRRRYKDIWNRYIAPHLALRAPQSLTPSECQSWANLLLAKGLAAASLHLCKAVLVSILSKCEREGVVSRNVATYIELPPIVRRNKSMALDRMVMILDRLRGTELAAPVLLAGVLGMRRGELCALKWANVDEATGLISIVEQRLVRQGLKGKKVAEAAPKTAASVRSFRIPKKLLEMLYEVGNIDSGYVCTRTSGRPWNPEHLTGEWAKVRDSLGCAGWRFHDLRHGAGGILAGLGIDLLTIAAILGHKNIATSQLYAAAQEATATKGLAKLGRAIGNSRR